MNWLAKDRLVIDPSLARHMVSSQFPQWRALALQPIRINGWDNTTFRLGDRMKVRFPTAQRYAAQVERQHRWLPHLATSLEIEVPTPIAVGQPNNEFPFPWAIESWIEGDLASIADLRSLESFAKELAQFLLSLRQVPTQGGPVPGEENFFRGGSLQVYDAETRACLEKLKGEFDRAAAQSLWEAALVPSSEPIESWVHGDVAPTNLIVAGGHLKAVIDFGCSAVGDPACDLVMAWTFFKNESREIFRAALGGNRDMWNRARGWAFWKALLQLSRQRESRVGSRAAGTDLRSLINQLLSEHSNEAE